MVRARVRCRRTRLCALGSGVDRAVATSCTNSQEEGDETEAADGHDVENLGWQAVWMRPMHICEIYDTIPLLQTCYQNAIPSPSAPNAIPLQGVRPQRPHKHMDPARYGFWYPTYIAPWNQHVTCLDLHCTMPDYPRPYYNIPHYHAIPEGSLCLGSLMSL